MSRRSHGASHCEVPPYASLVRSRREAVFYKNLITILGLMSSLAAIGVSSAHAQAGQSFTNDAAAPIAPQLDGLGTLEYRVTTSSPGAQRFFNQGLRLLYAFNH